MAALAEPPGAAMDEEDHRQVLGAGRCVDVELGRTVIEGLRLRLDRTPGG
ncbi:hypothetical protein ACVOMV_03125 [Mesorhizobium atlanticum]